LPPRFEKAPRPEPCSTSLWSLGRGPEQCFDLEIRTAHHPGGNSGANLKSISHRCYLFEVAFVWELTKETIGLPLGCLQGGTNPSKQGLLWGLGPWGGLWAMRTSVGGGMPPSASWNVGRGMQPWARWKVAEGASWKVAEGENRQSVGTWVGSRANTRHGARARLVHAWEHLPAHHAQPGIRGG